MSCPGKTGKTFELTTQILIGSKLELLFYEPQRKPQVSRLRQDRYKRGSSITLSLPLFSETLLPDKVLTQLTIFLHGSHGALSPLPRPLLQNALLSTERSGFMADPIHPLCYSSSALSSVSSPAFHLPHPAHRPHPPASLRRGLPNIVTDAAS